MRKFFLGLWKVITFPFRAVWWILTRLFLALKWIVTLPFRAIRKFHHFMTVEPDEHPLGDVFVDLVQDKDSRQFLWDQIDAFRMHLLRAVIGLAVSAMIAFIFAQQIMEFLAQPVGGLAQMQVLGMTESIGVFMQVALLCGFAFSLPYIVFELWLFAAPGLKPRERIFGLIAIPFSTVLFISGVLFTYFVFFPPAIDFLRNFAGLRVDHPQAKLYFSFVTDLLMWIGLSFEFPLVIYALTAIGFVKPQPLARQWRLAIVIIAIAAAAITPTVDPFSMGLVMIPMIVLYFISIGLSFIAYAGRKKPEPTADPEAG
jgi:sec-independent protein translocase protein TatC